MTAKNKEIEAKAKAKAKAEDKEEWSDEEEDDWSEIILGCAGIAGIIGVILLILWFSGFFGGEDEVVVVDDDVPESIVDQEQRDWYESKLEENGGTYDSDCWFWDFQGVFDIECGRLYTNAYFYGDWKDYDLHGWGKSEWFKGNKYKGNFKNGNYHGYGEMESAEGQKYEGYWKDNQRHGWGSYEDEDGVIAKGHYKNDRRHGRFEITAPNEEMEVVYYSDGEKVEEICEEIGFPKDSSKHEECIFDLVTETLSFEY
tara:strand:- start:1244 stop:2014 length:771 start_codon:yes stop_codon:yes gene_type:complete